VEKTKVLVENLPQITDKFSDMEREERIGINDGLPTMIPDLNLKLCFILIMINLFDRYLL
jgi:hypothetical protein